VPVEVQVHQEIAKHYSLPFINLSEEVFKRIEAKEFTWKDDFIDLHPSPFGHQLYFRTIRRLFEMSSSRRPAARVRVVKMPEPIDRANYSKGKYVSVEEANVKNGFRIDPSWKPSDKASMRKGFTEVPMLVSNEPGSTFELSFEGDAVGIAIVSGPDAGMIRYTIDGGKAESKDLFTQWSKSLHLPWYLMLRDGLGPGKHTLTVTLLEETNPQSAGSACRVVHLLVNQPE